MVNKLSNFSSSNELVAVLKRGTCDSNEFKLLTAKELSYEVQSQSTSGSKGNEPIMIQRFVKSIGSKAFIVRTCWFSNHQPYSFIVTNNSGFYDFDGVPDTEKYRTNPEKFGTCLITKNKNGKHLKDTLPYVKNIAKYFKGAMGIECKSIAADFIKDESGIWWMVSIKRLVTT